MIMNWANYFFLHEDGRAFGFYGSGSQGVFSHSVDEKELGNIKVSLVKGWHETRDKNITISTL